MLSKYQIHILRQGGDQTACGKIVSGSMRTTRNPASKPPAWICEACERAQAAWEARRKQQSGNHHAA